MISAEKKIRFRFQKNGPLKYVSHLDMIDIMMRALRRAGIEVKYSGGYNPRPRISFGPPLPLGIESRAEYADVIIMEDMSGQCFRSQVNSQLQERLVIDEAMEAPQGAKSLMGQVDMAEYTLSLQGREPSGKTIREMVSEALETTGTGDSVFSLDVQKTGRDGPMVVRIYGYTKTDREKGWKVFKLRDFLHSLKQVLSGHGVEIKSVTRTELFILGSQGKITPFEVFKL